MNTTSVYIGGAVIIALTALAAVWFVFSPTDTETPPSNNSLVGTKNQNNTSSTNTTGQTTNTSTSTPVTFSPDQVFAIAEGPIVGGILLQTGRPTTTVARYVKAENGHVFDLTIDSAGAVPKAISNTTIPGAQRAIWTYHGDGVILQYLDDKIVKTVHLAFPTGTTTAARSVKMQFLPDAIADVAVSPNGRSVAYLLRTQSGVDGYIANADGTSAKKLFSLPLSQLRLSWSSNGTLLLYSASAGGVPGMSFSVDVSTGATAPLLYSAGFTATADRTFSKVVYQTTSNAGDTSSYVYDVRSGTNKGLSFDPYPEKCTWSNATSTVLYCAIPTTYVGPGYLDFWRQGIASVADGVHVFNTATAKSAIIVIPGGDQGGTLADIAELSASPDDNYLLYLTKGARSLFGIRMPK